MQKMEQRTLPKPGLERRESLSDRPSFGLFITLKTDFKPELDDHERD